MFRNIGVVLAITLVLFVALPGHESPSPVTFTGITAVEPESSNTESDSADARYGDSPSITAVEVADTTPLAESRLVDDDPDTPSPSNPRAESPAITSPTPLPAYTVQPFDLEALGSRARSSIVNILCIGAPPLKSTSGSGVFITESGIIITNAHIGQYVLLSEAGMSVTCAARVGSPAVAEWGLETVYFPVEWAQSYAHTLAEDTPTGTGENDFAILKITATSVPSYLPTDSREEAITGGTVVLSSYPAEFISGADVRRFLQALTAYASIGARYTYGTDTLDAFSLGASPLAQQGSSGGAVVNAWGYLIGIITTTTVGDTTGSRDLRAITLGHIDRSIRESTGIDLDTLISREPSTDVQALTRNAAAILRDALR